MWGGDDYKAACTYWPDFRKFALETERRTGALKPSQPAVHERAA
jgi:hypothetical protein